MDERLQKNANYFRSRMTWYAANKRLSIKRGGGLVKPLSEFQRKNAKSLRLVIKEARRREAKAKSIGKQMKIAQGVLARVTRKTGAGKKSGGGRHDG